ncbi:CPBP family intramembrane glutamic endopeptidase [Salinactinospora qingdaonensis]
MSESTSGSRAPAEPAAEAEAPHATPFPSAGVLTPRLLAGEILCVLALSLGAAAVSAAISFVGALTAPEPLAEQTASLVGPQAAQQRPWLDLTRQISSLVFAMAPVALVLYLLYRSRESARTIGFDLTRPSRDLGMGAALAALVGLSGLVVYLVSWQLGLAVTVAPSALNESWWRLPVLVLQAVKNGVLEEVIFGYLLLRLGQLGWSPVRSTAAVALLRAFYHLYQGLGMFVGNLAMGLVFGWLYHRHGRVMPLVAAHSIIDIVAFVGSAYLIGRVGWLPGG